MRYYLDTEFIERPGSIQLISIGIVGEDGRTFYAENIGFDEREADDWVRENVLSKLRWWRQGGGAPVTFAAADNYQTVVFGTISTIRRYLLEFFANNPPSEFWGYYADYDWVVFCWIFGRMVDLPEGFPMYCRDLKQLLDESGKDKLPDPEGEHNALIDAYWDRELYKHLTGEC